MRKRGSRLLRSGAAVSSMLIFAAAACFLGSLAGQYQAADETAGQGPKAFFQKTAVSDTDLSGKYYYRTLPDSSREAYREMLEGIKEQKKEIYVHLADAKEVNRVFGFILNDCPDIFWCSGQAETTSYQTGNKKTGYSVFSPVYVYEKAKKLRMEKAVEEAEQVCLDGFKAGEEAGEYEKIKYVYEYLIKTVDYEAGAADSQNIYSALVNRKSVCAGYARATQYLLERMGVFCTYVTGMSEGQPHAWNLVRCNGKYYYVDTTWGDPVFRQKEGEAEIPEEQKIQYDYLCCNEEELFRTHRLDGTVEFPACDSLDENYHVKTGTYYQRYDKERIRKRLNTDVSERAPFSVFKFAGKSAYEEARKEMIGGDIRQAAANLAKWYGLKSVKYSYQDDEKLYKITVYWQYS